MDLEVGDQLGLLGELGLADATHELALVGGVDRHVCAEGKARGVFLTALGAHVNRLVRVVYLKGRKKEKVTIVYNDRKFQN